MRLDELVSPAVAADLVLVVPCGATEQHGPHLPIGTDTLIAAAVVDAVAAGRPEVVVAPAMPYGSSGEHASFPGTLSIGQAATEAVMVELGRSADRFHGVVFASGHAGNVEPLRRACALLRSEGRRAGCWFPSIPGGDAHAGHSETSLLLFLAPALVKSDAAEAGNVRPVGELLDAMRTGGVAAVAPNGVLGDPTGASAEAGAGIFEDLVTSLERVVVEVSSR